MKKLIWIAAAFLAVGCDVKSEDPVTTTTGRVNLTKPISVQWSPATGIVQGYKVEVSLDGSTFAELSTVDGSYGGLVFDADVGLKYWIRVRSYNQGGNSAYGPVQSIQL